jgi:hypothetical protein
MLRVSHQAIIITDALFNFDGGIRQIIGPQGTGGIFATYPQEFVSLEVGLTDQVKLHCFYFNMKDFLMIFFYCYNYTYIIEKAVTFKLFI